MDGFLIVSVATVAKKPNLPVFQNKNWDFKACPLGRPVPIKVPSPPNGYH